MIAGLCALVVSVPEAQAGTFDVKGVEVTKGESEIAVGAAWQRGFPVNSDFVGQSYEIGYGYGVTNWFKAGLKIGFEQPLAQRLEATVFGLEGQAVIVDPDKSRIGLAWYTGLDIGLKSDESEVLTFGPLISVKLADKLALTLNPLLQKSWAPSTSGIDFNYAWQIKRALAEAIALGAEGYGVIPDIGNAPGSDSQEHRLGPVLYLSGGDGKDGPKVEFQIGVLFGMTEATADTTGRAKMAITW
ncbi:MAG: hypothetical protein R3D68_11960 [Hyphomicrobiaceae bacterium]